MRIIVIVCFLTSSNGCFSILNIHFTGRRRKTKAATRDAWRLPRGISWWFPRRCGRIPWGLPRWCRRIPRGRWGIHWCWRSRRYLKTAVSQPLHVFKLYRRHKRSCTSTTGGKKWRTPLTKSYFLTFFYKADTIVWPREIQLWESIDLRNGKLFFISGCGYPSLFHLLLAESAARSKRNMWTLSLIAEVVTLFFFVRWCNTQLKWPFKRSRAVRSISGLSRSNPFWLSVEILFICRVWICCS